MPAKLRLLILEDEPNDAELEIAELEAAGYRCDWERVETREDFLDRLASPDYDLILSDYSLPSFDGLTALGLLKEHKIDIPFILVSGTLGEEFAIDSLKLGATDYVLKQRLSRLGSVVERALKEHVQQKEQREAEDKLEREREKLKAVFKAMSDGIYIIDQDYDIEYANPVLIAEFGSYEGHKCYTYFQDREEPCALCKKSEVFGGKTVQWECASFRNGKTYDLISTPMINADGSISKLEILRDITERKQAEAEKERLMAAIEQAAETIVITDAEGIIQYVNPAFEWITGYTREEALGQNPRILKSGEQDDAFYQAMWKTLAAGQTWSGRFVNRKKDETFYTEEATISPVKDSNGKTVNYVAIKSDITAELVREGQLRQAQKMDSVGRLAGGVAHDFNNILQTITGFSGLILAEMDARSAQRKDVLEIQKAARLAGELTQQLLAFSREHLAQHEAIDLNTVLSDGKKMLRQALDDSFKLHFKPEPRLMPVSADASQILQIAMNLIVNARDAMPEGGSITICVKNTEITEKDLSGWPGSRVGKWVCFSVSDTGCGMGKKQMDHLFEPFYTTKQVGKGTGLGLSVVYGIVDDHGGWISVSSKPGKGSVFKVFLPVHDADGSGNGMDPIDPDEFIGKRILLVEDDPVIRELTAEILQDIGYAVTVAADASEAERLFSQKKGMFNLLFIDVVLSDGNGIELAEQFLKLHPGLPVLIFSGSGLPDIEDRCKKKGFNFIQKPFNLKKLLDAVDRTIPGIQG